MSLGTVLAEHIERDGPVGFDEFVAQALYAPGGGFYTGGGGAGRRHDFLTSPEVGPLFGAVIARALDAWWDELGRPDPFLVVEAGAGRGALARSLLAATPRCSNSLRLVLVDVAEARWSSHPGGVESRADLPSPGELGPGPAVVLANELLDNLPFGLVELIQGHGPSDELRWCEVMVDVAPRSTPGGTARFVEVHRLLEPARQGWCWGRAGRQASLGTRLPVQAEASAWLAAALDLSAGGRVVVIDYASTTQEMARRPWTEWVRTYARHVHGGHPLDAPGTVDITCEVAVDQLALVRSPDLDRSQAEVLATHAMADLVAEGRARWEAEGSGGGLAAVAGRSTVHEAEALADPSGLGAFRVLEWVGPGPVSSRRSVSE